MEEVKKGRVECSVRSHLIIVRQSERGRVEWEWVNLEQIYILRWCQTSSSSSSSHLFHWPPPSVASGVRPVNIANLGHLNIN